MKKIFTLVTAVVMAASVWAEGSAESISFAYEAGAEIVTAYLWRGQYNGALSFQPTASIGFDAKDENIQFRFGTWFNLGASDWKFRTKPNFYSDSNPNTYFIPEVDFMGSLKVYGATVGFTHYYYFGGTPFFAGLEDDGGSQTELQVGYNFGDLTPVKLYINWYTMIAGNDAKYNEEDKAERAWSSYVEVGYDFELPHEMTIGIQVGFTPWKSLYTDYEGGFAVNNIQARFGKTWSIGEAGEIELFALGSLNTYDLNKDNCIIWKAGDEKLYKQKLNGCIGVGFWF